MRTDPSQSKQIVSGIGVPLFCFLFFAYGYFSHASGSNENSRFDQTRAIVELHKLSIDEFAYNTEDRIKHQGKIYPNKAPGASFLAVPFWWFFRQFFGLFHIPGPLKDHFICYSVTWTTVGLLSSLAGLCLYHVLKTMTQNPWIALCLTLGYSLGTIAFPFSVLFFSHQIAASLLLFSFALVYCVKQKIPGRLSAEIASTLAGFLSGYAVTTEYPCALAVLPLTVYAFFCLPKKKLFLLFLLGLGLGILFLAVYNLLVAGNLLFVSYGAPYIRFTQSVSAASNSQLDLHFAGIQRIDPLILRRILWSTQRGLFVFNPWLLMILPAVFLPAAWKKQRAETLLCVCITVSFVLFNSSLNKNIYAWGGGYSTGPRFLIPMLPFTVILAAPLLVYRIPRRLFYALCLGSVAIMLIATATEPRVPYSYQYPLTDFFWSHYRNARFGLAQLGNFNYNLNLPVENTAAFNLGKLLRLYPPIQLLPLAIFWLFMLRILVDRSRRECLPVSAHASAPVRPPKKSFMIVAVFTAILFLIPSIHALRQAMLRSDNLGLIGCYTPDYGGRNPEPVYTAIRLPADKTAEERVDRSVDFMWKMKKVPRFGGRFFVEWTGYLLVEREGTYRLATASDDGSCVYLDKRLVVNNWGLHPDKIQSAPVFLTKGFHPIAVRYFNGMGRASMKLLWAAEGKPLTPVTEKNLRIRKPKTPAK